MRTTEIYRVLGGLFVALVIATLTGLALRHRHPGSSQIANMNARIRAWWILVMVGGGALLAGPSALIALFAFISFATLKEFLPGTKAFWLCALVAIPLQYGLIAASRYPAFAFAVPVFALILLPLPRASSGVLLCVYCISYVPALLTLNIATAPLLMVFLVLIAQASDILQYIWGKLAGRHPLAPSISPSKTLEGLIGGVLSATALGAAIAPITPFPRLQAAALAFVIAILGFLGGLYFSMLKRRRGLKDWGSWISGHGGMLDRVDSLCFSAPVFFYIALIT